jgi:O-antigen/teichoic acid export membrane protein
MTSAAGGQGPSMPRRTAILLVGRVVSAGTTLVVLALVGRMRGDVELGAVALGFAVGSILAALSDLGTISLLVREAARQPERAGPLLIGLTLFRFVALSLAILVAAVVALVIDSQASATILLVATGLAIQSFAELTRAVFMARQRFTVSATHFVVENLAWFGVVAALLALRPDLPTALIFGAGLIVLGGSAIAGYVLVIMLAHVSIGLPTGDEVRRLARQSPPFAAFAVLGVAYTRIDTVIVGVLIPGGLAAAGSYYAATRLIASFEYVSEAAARGAFPELARRFAHEPDRVAPLLGQVARGLLLIGAAIPAVLVPTGDKLLPALFATPPETGWVLAALSVAVPIRYLGYLYGVALTSADAQGKRVAAAATALALVVVVNILAIPFFGLVAPVAGAIAAATVVGAMYALFVRRQFGSVGIDAAVVIGVGVASMIGALSGVAIRAVLPGPTAPVLGGVAALIVYALLAALGPARPMLRARKRAGEAGS